MYLSPCISSWNFRTTQDPSCDLSNHPFGGGGCFVSCVMKFPVVLSLFRGWSVPGGKSKSAACSSGARCGGIERPGALSGEASAAARAAPLFSRVSHSVSSLAQRLQGKTLEMEVVFPGARVGSSSDRSKPGDNLHKDGKSLVVHAFGTLQPTEKDTLDVKTNARFYTPQTDDHILAIVHEVTGEEYKLNIGARSLASLSVLAFDGATKRNRPFLKVGALIYARVLEVNRHLQVELTCKVPEGVHVRDWVTNESIFGELVGGRVFNCAFQVCKEIAQGELAVLQSLGEVFAFEIAAGANGLVWVNASELAILIILQRALSGLVS